MQNLDTKLRDSDVISNLEFIEIKVDQGAIRKYFKPEAQGRATILRTRYSHISVIIGEKKKLIENTLNHVSDNKGVLNGTKG